MKDYDQCELEVLAAVGELLISKLKGRDDLARAIFEALTPQFDSHYPHQKILTHIVLGQVVQKDETKEEIIARLQKGHGGHRPFPALPEKF